MESRAAGVGVGISSSQVRLTSMERQISDSNDSSSLVSSHQLASKLRKIKENLDNCYLTSNSSTTPHHEPVKLTLKKQSIDTSTSKSSNTPSSASSLSKLLVLNADNNFDFALSNDTSSLDFILDHIKYDDLVREAKPNKFNTNNNTNANATNLVSLKQTTYTDNLSRQSSIRSLISSEDKLKTNSNTQPTAHANLTVLTKPTNVNLISSASSGVLASVGVCTIPPTPQQFQPNKIRQIKAKSNLNANQDNLLPIYSKHEIDLLNDWDKYKPGNNNQVNLASNPRNNSAGMSVNTSSKTTSPLRKGRPETRLGFQLGTDTPDSMNTDVIVNNNNNVNSNNFNEYFDYADNSTVVSSPTLSNRNYRVEATSECGYSETPQTVNNNNNNINNFNVNNNSSKTINQRNGRVSVESVLSNFVSNLKFEEFSKQSNPSSSKKSFEEFNHDFDIVTVSEALTDELSTNQRHAKRANQKNSNQTPSLIIREKKPSNANAKTLPLLMTQNHNQSSAQEDEDDDDEDLDDENLDKSSSASSNQRVKNYQRLSHSINDLFSNLLQQLEKQKNKDYSNLNLISSNDLARLTSNSLFFNTNTNNNNNNNNKTNKYQNLSKDSNKDSGFNQEFICDDSSNRLNKQSSIDNNSLTYSQNIRESKSLHEKEIYLKPTTTTQTTTQNLCDDLSELSLLDRFLNNEQLVAFKHSKLERLLSKKFNIHDFTIIEYILNQEAISVATFKSLIREKFKQFKWSDETLNELHKIINQPIETEQFIYSENNNNNNNNLYNFSDYEINDDFCEENRLIPETEARMFDEYQLDKKSQTSSSVKSFKKIKLIKSSISQKRKLNQLEADMVSTNRDDLQETLLKTNLSFTKRRERKGSLPEINTSHISDFDTPAKVGNNTTSCTNFNHSNTLQNDSTLTISNNNNNNERISRKSAFVLEILRTSMFRSKSLSDLNSSLVKIERSNNIYHHHHHQNQQHNQTVNTHLSTNCLSSKLDESTNLSSEDLFNTSVQDSLSVNLHSENYIGLIWQCADMIYEEYKNKYEELRWLMNGDNLSVTAKLKEVEQRLRIEMKIRDKNAHLLAKLNTDGLSIKNKYVQQRLESQLKLINEKIKELEMMRLFLKMCEINNNGLEQENLNAFFNITMDKREMNRQNNMLEGKSCSDILKSLYSCESICSGFVYQFFVIYRYMFSSIDLLEFFKSTFIKALNSNFSQKESVLDRTIYLIGMWLDGFYIIDFQQNQELIDQLESFIETEIKPYDEFRYQMIYNLLLNPKLEFNLFSSANKKLELKVKNKNLKKVENETKKINCEIKKKILTKCKSSENLLENDETLTNLSNSLYRHANFFIDDYPCELVASQLTLIEWDNFLDIHVCHCLNSRAQGVNCDAKQPIDPSIINTKQCLFVDNYLSKSLYKMIQFNFLLSHWVSAEILMVENLKSQANVITKFLKIAKKCYDWSNFSSAFAIYDGLQEVTVRNLRAWQQVPHKTFQILDKISNIKLLFQNEPFLLNHLSKSSNTPVIPSMHLFLLIVQKSEHGSFKLANGEWKWSKLSNIANLVDQIRIVQQHYKCSFIPSEEFVEELLQRIYYFKDIDLNQLAENNFQDYFHNQKFNSSYTSTSIMNLIAIKKRL